MHLQIGGDANGADPALSAHTAGSRSICMPRPWALLAAASALPLALIQPALAEPVDCSEASSTVDMARCVRTALEAKDTALKQAMQAIASEAAAVPSEAFLPLWRDTLTGTFNSSADPAVQVEQFRAARLKACVFMNSLAFQGTGFGIFVTNCEIKLTDVLLEKLGN
jgi:uncharacterized protein YecT (DUF1311 family)